MVTRNASDDEPGPVLWWPCCPSVAPHMLPNPMWKKNEKDLCDSMFMLSIMFVSSRGQQTHHPTLYSVYMCLSYMETETERPSSCPFFFLPVDYITVFQLNHPTVQFGIDLIPSKRTPWETTTRDAWCPTPTLKLGNEEVTADVWHPPFWQVILLSMASS